MPPADQDGKKPAPTDSLLSDLDFGDDDFNWDQASDGLGPMFNSEDELPLELRRAVVAAPTATSSSAATKAPEPAAVKAEPALSAPPSEPAAPSTKPFDPLALPPLEGDAAPLPPLLTGGLLDDLDLDLPAPPSQPGPSTSRSDLKPVVVKPAVVEVAPLGELSDLALPVPSSLPTVQATATKVS